MIHSVSITAKEPLRVARVLAEICQGAINPCPANLNCYYIRTSGSHPTTLRIYPLGTELMPGGGQQEFVFIQSSFARTFTAIHATLSVPTSQAEIEQIARREGWRVLHCDRGDYEVIELWVENKLLLELLPPAIAPQYTQSMQDSSS